VYIKQVHGLAVSDLFMLVSVVSLVSAYCPAAGIYIDVQSTTVFTSS